jgi:lipopolysaccharide transport system ATP-binding protein
VIRVSGITKRFKLYHSPKDRLKEILFRKQYHRDFTALDTVSFEVGEGETLGIIGQNGAGKSTLLKILSGVIIPDEGTIEVDGKVTGLLELGTGFNPELTGVENIYMNGTFLGMGRDELDRKKQSIIDFTELGDFVYDPIKTYSSGMLMRLAFSIAIHAEPKCFLVDEALSVGDAYFQQKCMRRIQEFRAAGGSIIFVSHDTNAVKTLCDSAIMLESGKIAMAGKPKEVVDFYQGLLLKKAHIGPSEVQIDRRVHADAALHSDVSTGEVDVTSLRILNRAGEDVDSVETDDTIIIRVCVQSRRYLDDPHYGFIIRNSLGVSVSETNTYCMGVATQPLNPGEVAVVEFKMAVPLAPGHYAVSVGVANRGWGHGGFEEYLHLMHDGMILTVLAKTDGIHFAGVFDMHPDVRIRQGRDAVL